MNWDAIGAIGEIVGAIGVIGTLLYLAIQVRASTAATGTENRAALANGYREIVTLNLDSELAVAFRIGLRNYPNMPFDSRVKFANLCSHEALLFQSAFAQYEAGQLELETYTAYLSWIAGVMITPGGSKWWNEVGKSIYMPRLVHAVDQRISEGNVLDICNFDMYGLPDSET